MNIGKWGVLALLASGFQLGTLSANAVPPQPAQRSSAQPQNQDQKDRDAVAEAARRAREQKKQQPKATKVWDNDNLPTTPGLISIVGESGTLRQTAAGPNAEKPQTASNPEASPEAGSENAATKDENSNAGLTRALEQAKEHLQSASTDLDILSRKYVLDQQAYYGKPDYASDTEGAVALKAEESQIAAKKQEVADAQKQVDDLTAKLKELEDEAPKPPSTPQ
jgi:hypothetical protein